LGEGDSSTKAPPSAGTPRSTGVSPACRGGFFIFLPLIFLPISLEFQFLSRIWRIPRFISSLFSVAVFLSAPVAPLWCNSISCSVAAPLRCDLCACRSGPIFLSLIFLSLLHRLGVCGVNFWFLLSLFPLFRRIRVHPESAKQAWL